MLLYEHPRLLPGDDDVAESDLRSVVLNVVPSHQALLHHCYFRDCDQVARVLHANIIVERPLNVSVVQRCLIYVRIHRFVV